MVEITRLLVSEVTLPPGHPRSGAATPVFCYLISHPSGHVLVDTGVGPGAPAIDEAYRPIHHSLESALAEQGVAVTDIAMVVNTHLHFDHCGNNSLFPGVPLVVQEVELADARSPGYTVPDWLDFEGATWRPVVGEEELLPGLTVVATPGHTSGHQSVVVSSGDRLDVVAGQAVYDAGELESGVSVEQLAPDEAAATRASATRIKELAPTRVVFSHDAGEWAV